MNTTVIPSIINVGDLIECLKTYPNNLPIFISHHDAWGLEQISYIDEDKYLEDENEYSNICDTNFASYNDNEKEILECIKNNISENLSDIEECKKDILLLTKEISDVKLDEDLTEDAKIKKTTKITAEIENKKKMLEKLNKQKEHLSDNVMNNCLVIKIEQ
jgi:hypothetical protein